LCAKVGINYKKRYEKERWKLWNLII
jgi:hypothetical protein